MAEDAVNYLIAESLKYHNEAVKTLRNDYTTLQSISNINHNVDKYEELFQTIEDAANWHKLKIREILHGQFDFS